MFKVKIKIEAEIEEQLIEDVLITAFEGGSNYWYWVEKTSHADHPAMVSLFKDGYVKICDVEEKEMKNHKTWTLNKETIKTGIEKIAEHQPKHS